MAVLQFALLQRCEFVEEGHYPVGGDELDDQHVAGDGGPAKEPGVGSGQLKEGEYAGQYRTAQHGGQQQALREVGYKGGRRGPVEAVALLDDEGAVDAVGQHDDAVGQHQDAGIEQPVNDAAQSPTPDELVQPVEAAQEPEGQQQGQGEGTDQQVELRAFTEVLLRFAVGVRAENILQRCGRIELQGAQVEDIRDEVEQELEQDSGQDYNGENIHGININGKTAINKPLLTGLRIAAAAAAASQ